MGRAQNVNPVDLDRIDDADRPGNLTVSGKFLVDFLAQIRRELFGIVQLPMTKFFRENCHGRDNRPSQRATAGFIYSGDTNDTDRAQFPFVTKSATPIHRPESSADFANFHREIGGTASCRPIIGLDETGLVPPSYS